jgi:hypothetical protein
VLYALVATGCSESSFEGGSFGLPSATPQNDVVAAGSGAGNGSGNSGDEYSGDADDTTDNDGDKNDPKTINGDDSVDLGGAPGPAPTPTPTPGVTTTTIPKQTPPPDEIPKGDDPGKPVDLSCAENKRKDIVIQIPRVDLAPSISNNCKSGIEFNRLENGKFRLTAKQRTSLVRNLDIDLATYAAPDRVRIVAKTTGGDVVIFDSCRLRTFDAADPTNGDRRPPEASIREFHSKMPKGTKSIEFDFSEAQTPTYLRILGLCDFDLENPVATQGGRLVDIRVK